MYQYRYSIWDEDRFPGFNSYLDTLYNNSTSYFLNNTIKQFRYTKKEQSYELCMIDKFIKDIEYHYISMLKLGIITKKNYDNILRQIKSLSYIKMMSKDSRDLYGISYDDPRHIVINPDLCSKYGFSRDCFLQMCMSHEIGHIINMSWWDDAKKLSDELYNDDRTKNILKNMGLNDPKYLRYGFSLLDEVVVQETAERVAYRMANKKRPEKEYRRDKAVFNHNPYLTNYAIYGELQEFAIKFARSFDFVNVKENESDDDALLKLVRRSYDSDFIDNIRKELKNSSKKDDLIIMLACMGTIRAKTYQILKLNNDKKELDTMLYTNSFFKTAESTVRK